MGRHGGARQGQLLSFILQGQNIPLQRGHIRLVLFGDALYALAFQQIIGVILGVEQQLQVGEAAGLGYPLELDTQFLPDFIDILLQYLRRLGLFRDQPVLFSDLGLQPIHFSAQKIRLPGYVVDLRVEIVQMLLLVRQILLRLRRFRFQLLLLLFQRRKRIPQLTFAFRPNRSGRPAAGQQHRQQQRRAFSYSLHVLSSLFQISQRVARCSVMIQPEMQMGTGHLPAVPHPADDLSLPDQTAGRGFNDA